MDFDLEPNAEFDAFSNRLEPRVAIAEEAGNYPVSPMVGVVTTAPIEGRVEVRMFSGEIISNVIVPGGAMGSDGFLHGILGGVKVGQMVLVVFSHGNTYSPVIAQTYPFPGEEKSLQNYGSFITKETYYDEKEDILFGHSSGYKVWFTKNSIIIKDPTGIDIFAIDTLQKTVKITEGEISAVNTDKLEGWMTDIKSVLDNLYTAIQNSTTTPGDGGSSYKAGLVSALLSVPVPQIPTDLKKTNLSYSVDSSP